MKSSVSDLKKRGFPAEDVIIAMGGLSSDEYIRLLASPQADVRSVAAIHLRPVMAAVTGEIPAQPEAETAVKATALSASARSTADAMTEMESAQPTAQQTLVRPAKDTVTDALLTRLAVEKCLYTRLAICETLEKGDAGTARKMVPYLGKIVNNQHRCLPEKVSAFPLNESIRILTDYANRADIIGQEALRSLRIIRRS